jgi:hypothetical protein
VAEANQPMQEILAALRERAKELSCLYRADEILSRADASEEEVLPRLVQAIPPGWQYPDVCVASVRVRDRTFAPPGYRETPWVQRSDIRVQGERVGELAVCYTEERPSVDHGPFLPEESKLLDTIAERVGQYLLQRQLRAALASYESAVRNISSAERREWGVILDFLRRTDSGLLERITRKMINHLYWHDVAQSDELLRRLSGVPRDEDAAGDNRPTVRTATLDASTLIEQTFRLAADHLSESEITSCIQRWIQEDKTAFLADTLERQDTTLSEIANAIDRYQSIAVDEGSLPEASRAVLQVSLLRRFFTDQLEFLNAAKHHVRVSDFHALVRRVIAPPRSRGQLGGKSSGLFLASQIVRRSAPQIPLLADLKIPKTWYIASDALPEFIHYNNLEDLYARKYMSLDEVRKDYPRIVSLLKSCHFPPEITNGLAVALDDFDDRPLIVRSSSLLEDRSGAAFSGKYKSLFLANRGSKRDRLAALQDAIAEVYASIFGPDPIEYRAERGMLDSHEEMAILIQEVVGRRIGKYWFPAFAGIVFGRNDRRWSPRLRREDGLLRVVPGLGTRAVDRLSDDYPVLVAPGQPGLRANATPEERVRYSPRKMDVIDLESNAFETVEIPRVLRECGRDWPLIGRIVSRTREDHLSPPVGRPTSFDDGDWVVTFDGLIEGTDFVPKIRALVELLQQNLRTPVDLEFAADGEDLYLLQCRAQSYGKDDAPAAIPRNIPRNRLLFTANRWVANGRITDVSHVVYVDPEAYASLSDLHRLRDVGRAVGRINQLLPKRRFILMGPGRWGSRGDIKLGVSVGYSDINNTAALIELARRTGNCVPDLSFGTHFFQDLVEAGIRYLPLYPDEPDIVFDELFLRRSRNLLEDLAPEFASLSDVVRVIDVTAETGGRVLQILMNADLDEAVAVFAAPTEGAEGKDRGAAAHAEEPGSEEHWRWRLFMAERIAGALHPAEYGVKAMWVFGSTKNATAGPASDIDLLVHFGGDESQRSRLGLWLDGWSRCLAEANYLRTGSTSLGLLDVHWITDEDIRSRTSFALKIDAVTDAARPLPLGGAGA